MGKTIFFVTMVFVLSILITFHAAPVRAEWTEASAVNKAITTATGDQNSAASVSDGSGGAIIAWVDSPSGNDIYAQRMDSKGNVLWGPNGVFIGESGGFDPDSTIISDGAGGAIITWADNRDGTDIYAQRVDSDGTIHTGWTANGVKISTTEGPDASINGSNKKPSITSDGSGGAIIAWENSQYDNSYPAGQRYADSIYAQWVNAAGSVQWTSDVCISNGSAPSIRNRYKLRPKLVSDGAGGAIITWDDNRGSSCDIYAQWVNNNGVPQWTTDGQGISRANGIQQSPQIVSDGVGGAIISWLDYNYYNVYVQRVDVDGNVLWAGDRHISPAAPRSEFYYDEEYEPTIVSDGSGGAIIAWHDDRNIYDPCLPYDDGDDCPPEDQDYQNTPDESSDIYAQRVDADGNGLWAAGGIPISTGDLDQAYPGIVSDGAGGAIVFWEDPRNADSRSDLYAQRVFYDGTLVDTDGDGFGNVSDCNDSDPSINPSATEVCDDGKDNDCDGDKDAADSDCVEACTDGDDDGICDDGDGSGTAGDNPCPDGVTAGCDDNCPGEANPGQEDGDGDLVGGACDNCPNDSNSGQTDTDLDGEGDACDDDDDGDSLPDTWELDYGLDPLDDTLENGSEGDPDGDGITNCEEYLSGTEPDNSTSTPLDIIEVIPHENAGITPDETRVPNKTSFAVRVVSSAGVNIEVDANIVFTIDDDADDDTNVPDVRNLGDSTVGVTKLDPNEPDTAVTAFWAVYRRSQEVEPYDFERHVNISVNVEDTAGVDVQKSLNFAIENQTEHDAADQTSPPHDPVAPGDPDLTDPDYASPAGIEVTSGNLEGCKIIYESNEPVQPTLGPIDELPPFDDTGIEAVGAPMNLQPPTVFNTPVKILIPCPGEPDVSILSVYLYNGTDWVEACDATGNVLPGGEGWMVDGSRDNNNSTTPPTIGIKVYHFSGAQAGNAVQPAPAPAPAATSDGGGGGGGCFISTVASSLGW